MKYIERYLAQVKKHLPKQDKEDTITELRSLLLDQIDQMDDNLSLEEKEILVLKETGRPKEVAMRYKNDSPLISSEYEPLLFLIIKITSFSLPFALFIAETVAYANRSVDFNIMDWMLSLAYLIPSILNSLFSAYVMIVLVFILLSKYVKPKYHFWDMEFDPKKLPDIPNSILKVSIFEQIVILLGSVLFLYLMNLEPGLIAVYYENVRQPLLNSNFEQVLPYINIGVFLSLGLAVYHLATRSKSILSSTLLLVVSLYSSSIQIILANSDIFNTIIIEGYDLSFIPKIFQVLMYIAGIGTAIGAITNYIKLLIKLDH
jgi:hypothetical protein